MASSLPQRSPRGRLVAGVDIGSVAIRVAVAQPESGQLRVRGASRERTPRGAVERGVVRDPAAVAHAVRAALERAEDQADRRAEEIVAAVAGDDLRTHREVVRATRRPDAPLSEAELQRAGRDAERYASARAFALVGDEPALRHTALQLVGAAPVAAALDGRRLPSITGQRGRLLEIESVAAVLPAVQGSSVEAAVAGIRRRARLVAAPLALALLVAQNGVDDVVVVDVGASLTSVAVIRAGAVDGARSLSVGCDAFAARVASALGVSLAEAQTRLERGEVGEAATTLDEDAGTWARCVIAAARGLAEGEGFPTRALLAGGGSRLPALAAALERALDAQRPDLPARVEPLRPTTLPRVVADVRVDAADLVAVACAALGEAFA